MPGDGGLAVVGEDLDHVLIDEYPQGEILAFPQLERRMDVADGQCLAGLAGSDGEALVPVLVAKHIDSKLRGRRVFQDDLELHRVPGYSFQDMNRVTFDR